MKSTFTSKTDLAKAYFPYIDERTARQKLMNLISSDSQLTSQLSDTGYNKNSHIFSPAQVILIVQRFGNPY